MSFIVYDDTSDLTCFYCTRSHYDESGHIPCPLFFSDLDSALNAIAQCKFFCMVCRVHARVLSINLSLILTDWESFAQIFYSQIKCVWADDE